ncbi:unnamed protein product [Clavelina lepadiformis]|uniref:Uncharacterized protein n=1 Tax=Clavelina lepadiformis TaxID=159417 RepID=A0ABP0G697_CLALP
MENKFDSCIGDGGRIAFPIIASYAAEMSYCVSKDFCRDFDEGVVNSFVYISRKVYSALDKTCKTNLQGKQYAIPSCPVGKTIRFTVDVPLSSPISNSDITLQMLSKSE